VCTSVIAHTPDTTNAAVSHAVASNVVHHLSQARQAHTHISNTTRSHACPHHTTPAAASDQTQQTVIQKKGLF